MKGADLNPTINSGWPSFALHENLPPVEWLLFQMCSCCPLVCWKKLFDWTTCHFLYYNACTNGTPSCQCMDFSAISWNLTASCFVCTLHESLKCVIYKTALGPSIRNPRFCLIKGSLLCNVTKASLDKNAIGGFAFLMTPYLRIPAIHDVRPDMTHFNSNARLLIMSISCNIIHVFEA